MVRGVGKNFVIKNELLFIYTKAPSQIHPHRANILL